MSGITITGALIILVLAGFAVYGVKMGFIKAVFDLFSFLFTGLLTWLLYPVLAGILIKTPLYESLNKFLFATLKDNDVLTKSLPEFFIELPVFIKDSIIESSKQGFHSIVESTADALTVLLINVISIVVLFIVVRVLALLLKRFSKKINDIIIIGTVNKILGGLFGFIQGYFLVCLVLFVISLFPTGAVYERVKDDMEVSYTAEIMFGDNTDILGVRGRFIDKKGE